MPVRPRPGPQHAPLRHRLVEERRPRHPHQPALHRPAGLEQAAQGRGADRRQRRRARPHDQDAVERPGGRGSGRTQIIAPADHRRQETFAAGAGASWLARGRGPGPRKPHPHPRTTTRFAARCSAAYATARCRPLGQRRAVLPVPVPRRVRAGQQDQPPAQRLPAPGRLRRPGQPVARHRVRPGAPGRAPSTRSWPASRPSTDHAAAQAAHGQDRGRDRQDGPLPGRARRRRRPRGDRQVDRRDQGPARSPPRPSCARPPAARPTLTRQQIQAVIESARTSPATCATPTRPT